MFQLLGIAHKWFLYVQSPSSTITRDLPWGLRLSCSDYRKHVFQQKPAIITVAVFSSKQVRRVLPVQSENYTRLHHLASAT